MAAPQNNGNNGAPRAGGWAAAGAERCGAARFGGGGGGVSGDRWRGPRVSAGVAAPRAGTRPHTNKGRHVGGGAARLTWAAIWRVPPGGAERGAGRRRAGRGGRARPGSRCRPPGAHPPSRYITGGPRLQATSGNKRHTHTRATPSHGELCRGYETVTAQERLSDGGNGKPCVTPGEKGSRQLPGWERNLRRRGGRDMPLPERLQILLSLAVVPAGVCGHTCIHPYIRTCVCVHLYMYICKCVSMHTFKSVCTEAYCIR